MAMLLTRLLCFFISLALTQQDKQPWLCQHLPLQEKKWAGRAGRMGRGWPAAAPAGAAGEAGEQVRGVCLQTDHEMGWVRMAHTLPAFSVVWTQKRRQRSSRDRTQRGRPAQHTHTHWCSQGLDLSLLTLVFSLILTVASRLLHLLSKTMGCLSGCLMSSASIQKLFCGICSAFKCSFDEYVGEKVVSLSYSLPS